MNKCVFRNVLTHGQVLIIHTSKCYSLDLNLRHRCTHTLFDTVRLLIIMWYLLCERYRFLTISSTIAQVCQVFQLLFPFYLRAKWDEDDVNVMHYYSEFTETMETPLSTCCHEVRKYISYMISNNYLNSSTVKQMSLKNRMAGVSTAFSFFFFLFFRWKQLTVI